jgi:hypothetical protein
VLGIPGPFRDMGAMLQTVTILSGGITSGHLGCCPNPSGNLRCKKIKYGKTLCRSCSRLGLGIRMGSENPFYGRKHSAEALAKMRAANCGRRLSEEIRRKMSASHMGHVVTEETRRRISETKTPEMKVRLSARFRGKSNPFYGKFHSDESKRKISLAHKGKIVSLESRKKMSDSRRGEKNHMYGKPSPIGASNGIGGWYRNCYFRSSSELSFLLHQQDTDWISAESFRFRVPYTDEHGNQRFYFPDFFGNDSVVEVKARGWERDPRHLGYPRKARAAAQFYDLRGWEYVLAEIPYMNEASVFRLRQDRVIRLNRKWERRYQEWASNHLN